VRPGTNIVVRETPPAPPTPPTDTGRWFVAAKTTNAGPTPTVEVLSVTDFEQKFNVTRATSNIDLWDALDVFFREGGVSAVISRIAAASPADADFITALGVLGADLGPGQVSAIGPGSTSAAVRQGLIDHAATNNRIALIQGDGTAAAVGTDADTLRNLTGTNHRRGSFWAPNCYVPGVAGGTQREVPFVALQAGLMARVDAAYNPGIPAAGDLGTARFVTGLKTIYTDAERQTLNDKGANAGLYRYGVVRSYGYRATVDPVSDAKWLQLNGTRVVMAVTADANVVLQRYIFDVVDGRNHKLKELEGDLLGVLFPYWQEDVLYGADPDKAYRVNVGPDVNTPQTIADGQLNAAISLKTSPFAEMVTLYITKTAITEVV
jgi:hypothetical protein